MLDYRSIQIGVSGRICRRWAAEWIESIEDVTDKAKEMKKVLDEDVRTKMEVEKLVGRGLMHVERVYEVPNKLREVLKMDEQGSVATV